MKGKPANLTKQKNQNGFLSRTRSSLFCCSFPSDDACLRTYKCSLLLQDLFAAGEGKFGTDEETLIKIIGNRSAEHLRKGEHLIVPSSWCI